MDNESITKFPSFDTCRASSPPVGFCFRLPQCITPEFPLSEFFHLTLIDFSVTLFIYVCIYLFVMQQPGFVFGWITSLSPWFNLCQEFLQFLGQTIPLSVGDFLRSVRPLPSLCLILGLL